MTGEAENEERRLIYSVVADPNADGPRLAYADWLETHGQARRAELIRVQCKMEDLKSRERDLLDVHAGEWTKSLVALGVDRCAFHRGFPEEINISAPHFLDQHDRINEITPVCKLRLGRINDDRLSELARLPILKQIRDLEVGIPRRESVPQEFGCDGLRTLAASEYSRGMQRLTLSSHRIGEAGAKIIADSRHFGNLTHLTLNDPFFNTDFTAIHDLVNTPALGKLQELSMGEHTLGTHMLQHLRKSKSGRLEGNSP